MSAVYSSVSGSVVLDRKEDSLKIRLNISSAFVAGMGEDLALDVGDAYNIALLVFFPGYHPPPK